MTQRHHQGRSALVTGAGSGIGRAIARRLAAEGARVACLDRDHRAASATVELIAATGEAALAFEADVRDRAGVQAALEGAVEALGPLNYLVNNAGLITMTSLEALTDEEWDLVVDVNLKGQFIVTQLAVPFLKEAKPASIVNLSTVEAEVVVASRGFCQPHYNASKGGVKMLTKALAVELSRYGIRVNAIAPGPVQTSFIPGVDPATAELPRAALDRLLIPRFGQPEDIAAAASFLLSDDAAYITASQLVVDGGWLAR